MNSLFKLDQYLSKGIENIIKGAIKASLKNPKESIFIAKFALSCKEAAKTREGYEKLGRHIPSFLITSITNNCNLHCKGCYARANNSCGEHAEGELLSAFEWKRIFQEAVSLGISFILIAGGEPFMRQEVIEVAAEFKKIIFPIFTNGTLINDDYMKLLDKNRNLLPVLSIEGEEEYTDSRRGIGMYSKLLMVMEKMQDRGMFYGTSITVTKENIQNITDDLFLSEIYLKGCKVVFFIEYVPVDKTTINLALTDNDRDNLDRKLRWLRLQYEDMILLSFPGDEKGAGGCLAAGRGFFHVNPNGNVEPCPFSPYSDINLRDSSILEALQSPLFQKLSANNVLLREHKGGCVLFEYEEEVKSICNENDNQRR